MAFAGYLIKLGGENGVILPNEYIRYDTYEVEPAQRLDLDSTRDLTGLLHRNVLKHTATRIDFTVPHMDLYQHNYLLDLLRNNMLDKHAKKIRLKYWNDEIHDYREGTFYVPDLKFKIRHIDPDNITMLYDEFKMTFIEY